MIFRSLPSASRLAQCFLAAAGFLRSQFWCFFWAKKKADVSQGRGQQPLTYFKSMGIYTALASKAMVLCTRRRGRPVGVGVGLRFAARTSFYSQVLGATFMMNQLVVFDIQSLVSHWKNMGKMEEIHRKEMSCRPAMTPKVFSTWIDAKPMSQLCAEAKATRKTTARQVASC